MGVMSRTLALIGFGEAGSTFARTGQWQGCAIGWDIAPARRAAMAEYGVASAPDAAGALDQASLALSLVTADQALAAAQEYAAFLQPGAIWCDMNSVAPETKRDAAKHIEAAGAHYVDVAVLAPVHPAGLAVPLLLSGSQADLAAHALAELGFTNIRCVGDKVGRASTIKMVRSVMVKGLEALTDEMMAAAGTAGVVDEVLASLDASDKQLSWRERADYNLERMETHGARRAAEMEEVAKTLHELGVDPLMTQGTITRQRVAGERGAKARKDKAA